MRLLGSSAQGSGPGLLRTALPPHFSQKITGFATAGWHSFVWVSMHHQSFCPNSRSHLQETSDPNYQVPAGLPPGSKAPEQGVSQLVSSCMRGPRKVQIALQCSFSCDCGLSAAGSLICRLLAETQFAGNWLPQGAFTANSGRAQGPLLVGWTV